MKKLLLNKKVIIDLNNSEMKNLMGGVEPTMATACGDTCLAGGACPIPTPEMSLFCDSEKILCWDSAIC